MTIKSFSRNNQFLLKELKELGEFLWWIFEGIGGVMLFAIQLLSIIILVYTIFLAFISWRKPNRDYKMHAPTKKFLVLIPAHNEEKVVGSILDNLLHQINYPKELLSIYVIADNCTDNTAKIAKASGVKVIEHFSRPNEPKGKPYGIKYALDQLGETIKLFDNIAIFDADNLVSVDFFYEMNSQLISNPDIMVSQGYLDAKNVDDSIVSLGYSLSYFLSNRFFCFARNKLGLSPVIGGTGFVMDIKVIQELGWTVNSLTEDLELQMQCAMNGYKIVWNHFAPIYDEKPTEFKQSLIQRTRWARGHWTVNRRFFIPLIKKFVSTLYYEGRFDSVVLDSAYYCISPLAIAASPIILLISIINGNQQDLIFMILLSLISLFGTIFLALFAMQDDSVQTTNSSLLRMICGLVWYMGSAMLVYLYGILTYKQNVWIRTEHKSTTALSDII